MAYSRAPSPKRGSSLRLMQPRRQGHLGCRSHLGGTEPPSSRRSERASDRSVFTWANSARTYRRRLVGVGGNAPPRDDLQPVGAC